ncbi:ABC transporter permease [Enterococcus dispar]|uniref:ABC transporter permease n=1 Tax=Enterococcus dispar TaxID=44009 RepID=UPI0021D45433|nr:ABC transporter permease [Enterococcus dispar]MCU7358168.1 ABC transporter permease [Enterococcus dispar]
MLKQIYLKRYGKALIAFALVIFGIHFLNAFSAVSSWQSQNNYLHSKEFKAEYDNHSEGFTYWNSEKNQDIPYASRQDYITDQLYFYRDNYQAQQISNKRYQSYNPNATYFGQTGQGYALLSLLLVGLSGFLIFFIDEKTAFNRFLFSLPQKRSQLFSEKLVYVALPILGSLLLSQLFYICYLKMGIPAPYLNVTWGQLLQSAASSFTLNVLLFTCSMFIGSMVGNLVFGPLTWVGFVFFASFLPSAWNSFLNLFNHQNANPFSFNPENLFIYTLGKTGGYWWMIPIFLVLIFLFLGWTARKYLTLSLENDGDYLLHQNSRWPIWSLMWVFTSFIILNAFTNTWQLYFILKDSQEAVSFTQTILSTLVTIAIIGILLFLLVFFSSIKTKWEIYRTKKQDLRMNDFSH